MRQWPIPVFAASVVALASGCEAAFQPDQPVFAYGTVMVNGQAGRDWTVTLESFGHDETGYGQRVGHRREEMATADARGEFEILTWLTGGRCWRSRLVARGPGHSLAWREQRPEQPCGVSRADFDLVTDSVIVSGVIRLGDRPYAGAKLKLEAGSYAPYGHAAVASAPTGPDGRYDVRTIVLPETCDAVYASIVFPDSLLRRVDQQRPRVGCGISALDLDAYVRD